MDTASKIGYFVAGLIAGGVVGVVGMWLAYDAGQLVEGLKSDSKKEYEIEVPTELDAEEQKRKEPGYIKRLNEEARKEQ